MRIADAIAMVLVGDMDRALAFYRDLLGLQIEAEEEDWAVFAEGVGLMMSPEPLPPDALALNAVVLTFCVDDIEGAYQELTGHGVAFLMAPTAAAGGMVATLRDPDGNLLQLMQRPTGAASTR